MSESNMRQHLVRVLKAAGLDPVSVENPAHPGTPDLNYADGWLELKWVRSAPINPETPLLLAHFSPQQRVWLLRRWRAGGNVHLLLCCAGEWMLFDGDVAVEVVGKSTLPELRKVAKLACRPLDENALLLALKRDT